MEFVNVEKFRKFLKENLKPERAKYLDTTFTDWLDTFEYQVEISGSADFELLGSETKSKQPKLISFERIDKFYLDDKEVNPDDTDGAFDYVETTIIF